MKNKFKICAFCNEGSSRYVSGYTSFRKMKQTKKNCKLAELSSSMFAKDDFFLPCGISSLRAAIESSNEVALIPYHLCHFFACECFQIFACFYLQFIASSALQFFSTFYTLHISC